MAIQVRIFRPSKRVPRWRRTLLVAGAIGVASSAARTTRARDPNVDLEAAGYGGASTGGWTCGPTGTARYAGVGINATLSERGRLHADGPGLEAIVGAALERETVEFEACCTLGRTIAMAGTHARLGYGDRWFGIEAGVLGFQGWRSSSLDAPGWAVWPELKVRIGPPAIIYGVLGFGSDLPTTMRRPAFLYTGVGGAYEWGGFDVRTGFNRAGPALMDDFSLRFDGVARLRVVPGFLLAPGLAVQIPDKGSRPGWESSLTLELGL
jgi:hypothetical protein